ncbi:aldehyde reductase I [Cordyceps militaris CM01]|uniref:Aldehyde reductase I n=1 Tax=Cordyceps militaris (strain CM01) TaxID=983644 RepID=G3JPI1_CORMM|nr:aldehyde reductase I [Cordyceps militaris CM01]EGX89791.1 aldehyde reductase I [Cordyceps militaris CM01]
MSSGRTVTLNTGAKVPALGYGTWQAAPGEVGAGVFEALQAGYRHLDLAKVYGNQREVGEGIQRALKEVPGLKREDIFITSKLWNDSHQPENVAAALDETLQELGLEYLDLYLIHWPVAFEHGDGLFPKDASGAVRLDKKTSIVQTWKALTELPKTKTRAVGVSNFTIDHASPPTIICHERLEAVIKATGVTPAVNQIERHPRLIDQALVKYAADKHIVLTAYSAFGNNTIGAPLLIVNDEVKAVAERLTASKGRKITPAHVLLAWAQVGGHTVIPKSVTASRIRENFQEVDLEQQDIDRLNKIGEDKHRFNIPFTYEPKWNVDIFGDDREKAATTKVVV